MKSHYIPVLSRSAFALALCVIVAPGLLAQTLIIEDGAEWRFFRGLGAPPSDWADLDFDDSSWELGPSGFGYGDDDDATVLADMQGVYASVFLRIEFEAAEALDGFFWNLRYRYDDGFVAFIDGVEILRRNMLGSPPAFDELASELHEILSPVGFDESVVLEDIDVTISSGRHVLAVEVHNFELDSSDLSFSAELGAAPFLVTAVNPASGPLEGGNSVSVLGNGFRGDDVPAVRFDSSLATEIEFVNASRIDVVVPAGSDPGPVVVNVEDSRGSYSLVNGYSYSGDNQGLAFDGGDVARAIGVEMADEGSVEMWFRRDGEAFFNPWRILFAVESDIGEDAFGIEVREGQVRARSFLDGQESTLTASVSLGADEWHHIAFGFSEESRVLLFDQRVVATDTVTMVLPFSTTVQLGAGIVPGNFLAPQPFTGVIESARLWRVERDPVEFARNALRPITGDGDDFEDLAAQWLLDDGAGDVAADSGPEGLALELGAAQGPDDADPAWTQLDDFPVFALTALSAVRGPIDGGNELRAFGVGFDEDAPPLAFFGDVPVNAVEVLDRWTLGLIVPPGEAFGLVDVRLESADGIASLPSAYSYVPERVIPAVVESDTWDYFVAVSSPPADWNDLGFDAVDEGWRQGLGGLGYGDDDDSTVIDELMNQAATLYARREFELGSAESVDYLAMRIRFDDGYVAYLNGVEVARENIAGTPPSFDELASDQHEIEGGTGTFDREIDLGSRVNLLLRGINVLAIEVHNVSLDSSDLSLAAELDYSTPGRPFIRGDADGDGKITISDPVVILRYQYSGLQIDCLEAADVDDDGMLRINDSVVLLNYLFLRGEAPPRPFPLEGPDLDADALDCNAN